MTCTPQKMYILLAWSDKGEKDGRNMWQMWGEKKSIQASDGEN